MPDFEETTNSVASRSSVSVAWRIIAGWVVSSTWKPLASNVCFRTCGARLEPPIPSRTKVSITPGSGDILDER